MARKTYEVWESFSQRAVQARHDRGFTVRQLAERVAELGFDGPSAIRIRQIEAGGRAGASADVRERLENVRLREVIALAAALDVAPVYLIAPLDNVSDVRFGAIPVPAAAFRSWLRGLAPIGGDLEAWWSFYFSGAPPEQRRLLQQHAEKARDKDGPLDVRVFLAKTNRKHLAQMIAHDEARRQK